MTYGLSVPDVLYMFFKFQNGRRLARTERTERTEWTERMDRKVRMIGKDGTQLAKGVMSQRGEIPCGGDGRGT